MNKKFFHVSVDKDFYDEVREKAKEDSRSITSYIVNAVKEKMKGGEK